MQSGNKFPRSKLERAFQNSINIIYAYGLAYIWGHFPRPRVYLLQLKFETVCQLICKVKSMYQRSKRQFQIHLLISLVLLVYRIPMLVLPNGCQVSYLYELNFLVLLKDTFKNSGKLSISWLDMTYLNTMQYITEAIYYVFNKLGRVWKSYERINDQTNLIIKTWMKREWQHAWELALPGSHATVVKIESRSFRLNSRNTIF